MDFRFQVEIEPKGKKSPQSMPAKRKDGTVEILHGVKNANTRHYEAMLRTLIEDRFGLVWRLDPTGKMNVYTLRMARDDGRLGPGIRRSEASCLNALGAPVSDRQLRAGMPVPCGSAQANGVHAAGNMRLGMLATMLQLAVDEEVIDRTGLTGTFDFYITLPREGTNPSLPGDVSIFTAVQEQLGMKLQREEITRNMFLVEKVSQPTPN